MPSQVISQKAREDAKAILRGTFLLVFRLQGLTKCELKAAVNAKEINLIYKLTHLLSF